MFEKLKQEKEARRTEALLDQLEAERELVDEVQKYNAVMAELATLKPEEFTQADVRRLEAGIKPLEEAAQRLDASIAQIKAKIGTFGNKG